MYESECGLCQKDVGDRENYHKCNDGLFHIRCEHLVTRLQLANGLCYKDAVALFRKQHNFKRKKQRVLYAPRWAETPFDLAYLERQGLAL